MTKRGSAVMSWWKPGIRWRAALGVVLCVAFWVPASSAHADSATKAWIGNAQGTPTGVDNNWFINPGSALFVDFGLSGPAASTEEAVLDVSAAGGHITLSNPDNYACTLTGSTARCHGSMYAPNVSLFSLEIRADASTPLSVLGPLVSADQGGASTAQVMLYADNPGEGAHMRVDTTSAAGRIGDVVQVAVTIRNDGPNPQPYWGIGPISAPVDAEFIGVSGCAAAFLTATSWPCGRSQPQLAGNALTVYLRFRISSRPAAPGDSDGGFGFMTALTDPNPGSVHNNFTITLSSAATGAGSGAGSGAGAAVTDQPARPPSPSPSAPAASPSSLTPTESASPPPGTATPVLSRPVSVASPNNAATLSALVLIPTALILTLTTVWYRRRNRDNHELPPAAERVDTVTQDDSSNPDR